MRELKLGEALYKKGDLSKAIKKIKNKVVMLMIKILITTMTKKKKTSTIIIIKIKINIKIEKFIISLLLIFVIHLPFIYNSNNKRIYYISSNNMSLG